MGWFSRLFHSRANKEDDPILSRCKYALDSCNLQLDEDEFRSIERNREIIASSPIGGAYVHKDVFDVICYLCAYDGLFERGIELIQNNNFKLAILSLDKVNKLLNWPSVIFAIALSYESLGMQEEAIKYYRMCIENFNNRNDIISNIVPLPTPSRENFIKLSYDKLNNTNASLLGYRNMQDILRVAKDKIKGSA